MGSKMTPLAQVKAEHGEKSKLVDAVLSVIDLGDSSKDDAKTRLASVSNKKLLRLLRVGQTVKDKYGSTEKLAEAVAAAAGKAKDNDYLAKLKKLAAGKLLDLARGLKPKAEKKKAAAAKAPAAEKAPAKKAAAGKKAPAKAPAGKKAPAKAAAKAPAAKKAAPAAKKAPAKAKTTKKS